MLTIIDKPTHKTLNSPAYNYVFRKSDGLFVRYGATPNDDPDYSEFGPELLDIEISEVINYIDVPSEYLKITNGTCLGQCPQCYKCNNKTGDTYEVHMTHYAFKQLLDKLPNTVTQIAFGLTNTTSNPDFWLILQECRNRGIVPNLTTHGQDIDQAIATKLTQTCGAVAVSVLQNEKQRLRSYQSAKLLLDSGMKQVNFHYVLAEETHETAFKVLRDIVNVLDGRLNAIVFLSYKHKNANSPFHPLSSPAKFKKLTDECERLGITYGMDSCGAHKYLSGLSKAKRDKVEAFVEPCESTRFSLYINCRGVVYPCSFLEGEDDWKDGISVFDNDDFMCHVWNHPRLVDFRNYSIECLQQCKVPCHYNV